MNEQKLPQPSQSTIKILTIAFILFCTALPAILMILDREVVEAGSENETIKGILGTAAILALVIGHALAAKSQQGAQYITSLALREACAIFGFIISLITGDHMWSIGASLVAVLSIIGTFPKKSHFV